MKASSRARIIEVQDKAAEVFATLDTLAPQLEEPERGAALELRAVAADLVRRLGVLAVFGGAGPGGAAR